jgi:hypothetical protein
VKKLFVLIFIMLFAGCATTSAVPSEMCVMPGHYMIEHKRIFANNNKNVCPSSLKDKFWAHVYIKPYDARTKCGNISTTKVAKESEDVLVTKKVSILTTRQKIIGTLVFSFSHSSLSCQAFYNIEYVHVQKRGNGYWQEI